MTPKSPFKVIREEARERVKAITPILRKAYPEARIALEFVNPLELLIATILSAQCTDARVNLVTQQVFKKYRSAQDWAQADLAQIEQDIRSTGFYHNKSVNIQNACRKIVQDFGGRVPGTMDELLTLPGVGRKTANCVLGDAFGIPGITCDTHVIRLSRRLGLSAQSDPVKLEFDLQEIVPHKEWTRFSHLLITHGRQICTARKPKCPACPVARTCPALKVPSLM
jgi:endonuclease III